MSGTAAPEVWDVKRLLEWTSAFFARKGLDAPRLSAEMLLGHVLGLERIKLYTSFDRALTPEELATFRDLVRRAGEGEPVQYLVGVAHFYSLELDVSPAVLIPRPDTETLVEAALRQMKLESRTREPLRALDLCTGSGAIAVALAKNLPAAQVIATDLSPDAAAVARQNVEKLSLGERVEVREGDLFAPVADEPPFDLIACNPPYIPAGDLAALDRNVRNYEPHLALDGGPDGLEVFRRLLADSPAKLVPEGRLYAEMQYDQGPALKELAEGNEAWDEVRIARDLEGRDRVLCLRRRAKP